MQTKQVRLDQCFYHSISFVYRLLGIAGYVESYIVLPSTIWGIASRPLVDAGIMNAHSIQIPSLIHAALDRGRAGMVGEGKNIWPDVNVNEGVSVLSSLMFISIIIIFI